MKICQEGFYSIFNVYFGGVAPPSSLYVGLYTNTSEPVRSASLTDISELAASGYTRKEIPNWTIVNSTRAWANGETVSWSIGLSTWSDVNGYFVTNVLTGTAGLLIAVNSFLMTKNLFNEIFYATINFTHPV